ncbi:MAG: hypothetical protein FJ125_17665, partial [Deltaproteobacteria bacterium]|nr:hypothetical protein [Deltaproteobacteria bacterium]
MRATGGAPAAWRIVAALGSWLLAIGGGAGPSFGSELPLLDVPVERLAARAADVEPSAPASLPAGTGGRSRGADAAADPAAAAADRDWIVRPRPWGDGWRLFQGQHVPLLGADA